MDDHPSFASDLLTVSETAELLRLKVSTIRAWTGQRRIPFVKVGRLVRIKRSDAQAYIASRVVEAADASLTGAEHGQR